MQGIQHRATPMLAQFSMPSLRKSEGLEGFSKYASQISKGFNPYADVDLKNIKTKTVKVTEFRDGKHIETTKEMAVCPECGSVSCACLARVTLQKRLDEENASGVRNEKPNPLAILPQSFNQMHHKAGLNGNGASGYRF